MSAKFSGFNPKGPHLSLEKEKVTFCVVFTYFAKRAREIRKFLVDKKCKKKSVMHVQSCGFANLNLSVYFFVVHVTVAVARRCLISALLLPSRNLATMVT